MLAPADTNNNPVYDFGLARVRYRDVQDVDNVRVFFRLWPRNRPTRPMTRRRITARTRSGTTKVPLLGIQGDEIVTIPFFATPRVGATASLTQQPADTPNVQSIKADPVRRRDRRLLRLLAGHQSAQRSSVFLRAW